MKAVVIIPARYASTRLPGKMLLQAGGKPLIQHTYERARQAKTTAIVIATDDERILNAARSFGAEAVMTDPNCQSGSERAAEAAKSLDADIIVNVQGDEPEINPAHIDRLIAVQSAMQPFASTLARPFPNVVRPDDPSAVKVVLGRRVNGGDEGFVHEALYFTRALAPFPRDGAARPENYHLHLGVYAYRRDALQAFASAPQSRLEKIEKLEQLRILEMGERILVAIVGGVARGIDTPGDFAAFKARVEARR